MYLILQITPAISSLDSAFLVVMNIIKDNVVRLVRKRKKILLPKKND